MLRTILWKVNCWWLRVRHGVLTVGTPPLVSSPEPTKYTPVIDLVRHRKTGQVFLVEHAPYARIPGALTTFGEPHEIPEEKLKDSLMPTAIKSLDAFEKREAISGETPCPAMEKLYRSRSAQWLSITRDSPLSLTICPIHRKSGGQGQSLHEEKVTLTLPCSDEDFLKVVEAAWRESGFSIA